MTPTQVFFCEYYEIFKSICFEGHLRTTASAYLKKPNKSIFRKQCNLVLINSLRKYQIIDAFTRKILWLYLLSEWVYFTITKITNDLSKNIKLQYFTLSYMKKKTKTETFNK